MLSDLPSPAIHLIRAHSALKPGTRITQNLYDQVMASIRSIENQHWFKASILGRHLSLDG